MNWGKVIVAADGSEEEEEDGEGDDILLLGALVGAGFVRGKVQGIIFVSDRLISGVSRFIFPGGGEGGVG